MDRLIFAIFLISFFFCWAVLGHLTFKLVVRIFGDTWDVRGMDVWITIALPVVWGILFFALIFESAKVAANLLVKPFSPQKTS